MTSVDYQAAVTVLHKLAERDQRRRQAHPRSEHDHALRATHAEFQVAEMDLPGRRAFAVTIVYNPPRPVRAAGPCNRILENGTIQLIPSANRLRDGWVRPARVQKDLDGLHRAVDRQLFGSHFNGLTADRRTSFRGLIENVDTNIHVHATWSVPVELADEFPRAISRAWYRYSPGGSVQADPIRDDGQAWGWYSTKCCLADLNDPDLFVASRSIAAK